MRRARPWRCCAGVSVRSKHHTPHPSPIQCSYVYINAGLLATIQHVRVRRSYDIHGSIPSDCVRATCCTCCTLVQDEREIKLREETARQTATGVAGTMVSVPYATPGPMAFDRPPG